MTIHAAPILRPLASLLVLAAGLADSTHAATYVRINQVGYESGEAARAYVMTTSPLVDETYAVRDAAGAVVACGHVGSSSGKWGRYVVHPLDFTVYGSGTYTVEVSGSASAASAPFRIASAHALYAKSLANTLSYYQTSRDGPDFIANALRSAPAHLNDASAAVYRAPRDDGNDSYTADLAPTGRRIDASGGWFDAGDYLKFVETHSYTVGVMLTGIRDFPDQMGAGSAASDFTDEAEFGVRWLLKMWDDSSRTLHYQVGVGIDFTTNDILSDHDFWRLPQADDDATPGSAPGFAGVSQSQLQYIRHRPVFVAGPAGSRISPNLAGRLAADFALCFQVFHTSDPALAGRCLMAAEHVYALADTAPRGDLLTTSPHDFYPESVWQDDMEWGATELAIALERGSVPAGLPEGRPSVYLSQAAHWAKGYIAQGSYDSLNLYDVAGLAHFDLSRALTRAADSHEVVTAAQLLSNLRALLQANAPANDPFDGLYTWSKGDSGSHVAGLSAMASEIGFLADSSHHATVARRQAASMLGANGWGVSQIIGDGTTFPDCPQHQPANLVGSHDGRKPVLAGAVVEGPNASGTSGDLVAMARCGGSGTYSAFDANGAVYWDWVQSYSTDEPAIDLTATSMLMFAWRMAGRPAEL
jgi:endoglucanase